MSASGKLPIQGKSVGPLDPEGLER
jgi:hypothetical protein